MKLPSFNTILAGLITTIVALVIIKFITPLKNFLYS